jgi:hypothetical protein
MTASEMIDRYVHAVVRRLPQVLRADISAELTVLLTEEVEARAGDAAPDEAAARDLLADYGPPDAMALRYHTPAPVLDPRDTRLFGKIAVIILGAISILAIGVALSDPAAGTDPMFGSHLTDEATKTGLQSLGLLLLVFWVVGTLRRRTPPRSWSPDNLPPVRDPDAVNRALMVPAIAFWAAGLAMLAFGPSTLVASVMGADAPAPLLAAFAYDAVFAAERSVVLWALLALAILGQAWPVLTGRWTRLTRRINTGLTLVLSVALLQTVLAGDVFAAEPANELMKLAMALSGGWGLLEAGSALWRDWQNRVGRDGPPTAAAKARPEV